MKKYAGKLIAPIIITALILLYFIGFIIIILTEAVSMPPWAVTVGIIVPLCLAGVMVYVLVERIKEIRSGEEDDLSQY